MAFKLPSLPYAADALEPHIDAKTMEIHHGKHHNGYTTKLNAAIEGTALEDKSIEEILGNLDMSNAAVRNNGGGYYNHCLFWEIMGPDSGEISSELSDAIHAAFGSFEAFKDAFSKAAMTRFGSGWAWLSVNPQGQVLVESTANQDSPIMHGNSPLLGVDVWEHAYYLLYQNRRADYLKAFFSVVDWDVVASRFAAAK